MISRTGAGMSGEDDWLLTFGQALCKLWGIDPDQCMAIDIHLRPRGTPTATVELLVNESVVHELLTLVPGSRRLTDEAETA